MTKSNKPGPKAGGQKPTSRPPQKNMAPAATNTSTKATPTAPRGKQSDKDRKPAIGGKAVTGAKSTIPKEVPSSGPVKDRPELYNRTARRRMQQMGTGPYNEATPVPARKRFEKRAEERKKRQEAVKKTVVTKGPSTKIKIGNRNTYFMLTALGIIVLVIVIAIIVRHPF
jgi:hypothetical protein